MRKIKIQSILVAVAGLFLATSCSSSFLDTDPTDAVSSDKVSVPENAEALVNGAWYNLFDYSFGMALIVILLLGVLLIILGTIPQVRYIKKLNLIQEIERNTY